MNKSSRPRTSVIVCAVLGAIVVHPVVFLSAYIYGLFFTPTLKPMGASVVNWKGGSDAVAAVVMTYIFTFLIAPLVLSVVGVIIGSAVGVVISWVKYGDNYMRWKSAKRGHQTDSLPAP